jgi:hypothetical protein
VGMDRWKPVAARMAVGWVSMGCVVIEESRLARRVRRDFPEPGSAPEVLRLLAGLAGRTGDEMLASERVHAAVVLMADGNFGQLRLALDLAAADWRDVLVAAGLADADWPQRLEYELGRAAADSGTGRPDGQAWLPARQRWTDADGRQWTRRKPRWLTERAARRLLSRASTLVAVERASGLAQVEWLDHAARRDYWDHHAAGHIDDGTGGGVRPNAHGITYRVTTWSDPQGGRLILLSQMC